MVWFGFLQQFLELLGLVDSHHPELALPAVEGLLADLLLAADIQDRLIGFFRLAQDADLLFCGIPFAFPCMGPSKGPD